MGAQKTRIIKSFVRRGFILYIVYFTKLNEIKSKQWPCVTDACTVEHGMSKCKNNGVCYYDNQVKCRCSAIAGDDCSTGQDEYCYYVGKSLWTVQGRPQGVGVKSFTLGTDVAKVGSE